MADEVDLFAEMSVVIVDDNRNFLKLVRSILRNFGLKDCTCFDDPVEALAYLEIHRVKCVITDLIMPKMNGFELAHKIRHSTEIANRLIPIILVTGHANRENIGKAISSGIDEVLVKPFRPVDMRNRLLAIASNPRGYLDTDKGYSGPDRRRLNDPSQGEASRRKEEDLRNTKGDAGKPERQRADYFDQKVKREPAPAAKTAQPTKPVGPSDVFTVARPASRHKGMPRT